jgi:outer membrane protein TolC
MLEASRFAGELAADTKSACFEAVAARDRVCTARAGAEFARAALQAVRQRVRGGVATKTEVGVAESQALGADLALQCAEMLEVASMRRLAALLSISRDLAGVALADGLPEPDEPALDREAMARSSSATRLDLRAATAALAAAEAWIALERRRARPDVEASVSVGWPERGASVDLLAGPGLAIELPLFDRNAAAIRRAELERVRVAKEREALAAEVAQEVRAAIDRAAAARTARFVVGELSPQAERSAALARTACDLGDTTVLPLLESERVVLIARQNRVEALMLAAKARIDVERATGAPLAAPTPAPAASGSARRNGRRGARTPVAGARSRRRSSRPGSGSSRAGARGARSPAGPGCASPA